MKLVMLGSPASGKSTQIEFVSKKMNIPAIAIGDALFDAVNKGSSVGRTVKEYMNRNESIPDAILADVLKNRISEGDANDGFILEGFPTTVQQAQVLERAGIDIDLVVELDIPDESAIARTSERRVCDKCGSSYHVEYKPTKHEGKCDLCDGNVVQRLDDTPEMILSRIENYQRDVAPLREFYEKQGKLKTIAGTIETADTKRLTFEALESDFGIQKESEVTISNTNDGVTTVHMVALLSPSEIDRNELEKQIKEINISVPYGNVKFDIMKWENILLSNNTQYSISDYIRHATIIIAVFDSNKLEIDEAILDIIQEEIVADSQRIMLYFYGGEQTNEIQNRLNINKSYVFYKEFKTQKEVLNNVQENLIRIANTPIDGVSKVVIRSYIEQELKKLNKPQSIFFAWLCSVRALPFIAMLEMHDKSNKLLSTFYDLDYAASSKQDVSSALGVVYNIETDFQPNAEFPPFYADEKTDITTYILYIAMSVCDIALKYHVNLHSIIASDVENIILNRYDCFSSGTFVYGNIWDKFQNMLKTIDCEYWGSLYSNVFSNGFQIDNEALNQRLSVPKEVQDKGAKEVVKYLENLSVSVSRDKSVKPTNVFISYAYGDKLYIDELYNNLNFFESHNISIWSVTELKTGESWREKIEDKINSADIIIVLASSEYIASKSIMHEELPQILNKIENNTKALLLWIPIGRFIKTEFPFDESRAVCSPNHPLNERDEDERKKVYIKIYKKIIKHSTIAQSFFELNQDIEFKSKNDVFLKKTPLFFNVYLDSDNEQLYGYVKNIIEITNTNQSEFRLVNRHGKTDNRKIRECIRTSVIKGEISYERIKPELRVITKANRSIIITDKPFDDNWFSHSTVNYWFMTVSDWDEKYAPPPMDKYILHEIIQFLAISAANLNESQIRRKSFFGHTSSEVDCLFGFRANKSDIKVSIKLGKICKSCKNKLLNAGATTEQFRAIATLLNLMIDSNIPKISLITPLSQNAEIEKISIVECVNVISDAFVTNGIDSLDTKKNALNVFIDETVLKISDNKDSHNNVQILMLEAQRFAFKAIISYFKNRGFDSQPWLLTLLSTLPPLYRIDILEGYFICDNSVSVIDKLSMAYLKNDNAEKAVDFLISARNKNEINNHQYNIFNEKIQLLKRNLDKFPIANSTEAAKQNFLKNLHLINDSEKDMFICLFSLILNVSIDEYLNSKKSEFELRIESKFNELTQEQMVFFVWLCGVRVLPFIGAENNFNFWTEDNKLRHIYNILYALDISYNNIPIEMDMSIFRTFSAVDNIDKESHEIVFYAIHAINSVARCVHAFDIETAIDVAFFAVESAKVANIDFESVLFDDIQQIKSDTRNYLNNDIKIYGEIWGGFQKALLDLGCDYWGKLYENIFKCKFKLDKEEFYRRLNVPEDVQDKGAEEVARYLVENEWGEVLLNELESHHKKTKTNWTNAIVTVDDVELKLQQDFESKVKRQLENMSSIQLGQILTMFSLKSLIDFNECGEQQDKWQKYMAGVLISFAYNVVIFYNKIERNNGFEENLKTIFDGFFQVTEDYSSSYETFHFDGYGAEWSFVCTQVITHARKRFLAYNLKRDIVFEKVKRHESKNEYKREILHAIQEISRKKLPNLNSCSEYFTMNFNAFLSEIAKFNTPYWVKWFTEMYNGNFKLSHKRIDELFSLTQNHMMLSLSEISDLLGAYDNYSLPSFTQASNLFEHCTSVEQLCREAILLLSEKVDTGYNQIILSSSDMGLIVCADAINIKKLKYKRVGSGGLIAKSFYDGEILNVSNVREHTPYINAVPETRSELVVPMISDGKVWGVINSESEMEVYYNQNIENEIRKICDSIAQRLVELGHDINTTGSNLPHISTKVIDKAFEVEIEKQLQELNRKQVVFFAWLCAVRSFPLLSKTNFFNKNALNDVYRIIKTIDTAYLAKDGATRAFAYTIRGIYEATNNNSFSDYFDTAHGYALYGDNNLTVLVRTAFATPDDAASYAAVFAIRTARLLKIDLEEIIMSDIRDIKQNKALYNDKSVYNDIWLCFKKSLVDIDCEYWYSLYVNIFESAFKIDNKALKYRLSVPSEIQEQGAVAVGDYLDDIENNTHKQYERKIKPLLKEMDSKQLGQFSSVILAKSVLHFGNDFFEINSGLLYFNPLFIALGYNYSLFFNSKALKVDEEFDNLALKHTVLLEGDNRVLARSISLLVGNCCDYDSVYNISYDLARDLGSEFREIIIRDAQKILSRDLSDLRYLATENNDKFILFLENLRNCNAQYWVEWFKEIFENNFMLSQNRIDELTSLENEHYELSIVETSALLLERDKNVDIDLFNSIFISILESDYENAKRILCNIENDFCYEDLINEAFFLTCLSSNNNVNAKLRWQTKLWQLISKNSFEFISENSSESEKTHTETTKVEISIKTESINIEVNNPQDSMTSGEKGKVLEEATVTLFKKLFELDEITENEILTKVRKQKSGSQFGFDVKVQYRTPNGEIIECRIECKNYKDSVPRKEIADKIDDLRNKSFEHFIIISPISEPDNALENAVDRWNDDIEIAFRTQVWSPESMVKNFFGLEPIVYEHFYGNDGDHPDKWSEGQRESVIAEFKKRLKPRITLPKPWEWYVNNPNRSLLFKKGEDEFGSILAIHLRALNIDGVMLNGFLTDHVLKWLKNSDEKCLFILGEFGDGKTFFTYCLSQKLISEYVQAPKAGYIPVRFALQDFSNEGVYNSHEFVKRRFESFDAKADFQTFRTVYSDNKMLVILDGFDEMSKLMDEATIAKNIERLIECCEEEFSHKNIKILITSRKHFFENNENTNALTSRLESYKLLQIAPVSRKTVISHLETIATDKCKINELQKLYDPIGLASKPLFLEMLKATINNLPTEDLNEVKIYEEYIRDALNDKFTKHLAKAVEGAKNLSKEIIIDKITEILEDIAIALQKQKSNEATIRLDDIMQNYEKNIAEYVWALTEPTEIEKERATNTIAYRSLLVRSKIEPQGRPVDFCHRSMREYFVARKIYKMLSERDVSIKALFEECDLNPEIVYFISQLVNTSNNKDICINELYCFMQDTSLFKRKGGNRDKFERLGRNAVNILCKIEGGLSANQQYTDLILDGANLMGADLSNMNFSGSSLRRANLYNVDFTDSEFIGANITGAQFAETCKIISVFYSNDNYVYVLYSDNHIRRWNINNDTLDKEFILEIKEEKPTLFAVNSQDSISVFEQSGKMNRVSFYDKTGFNGEFKIADDLKIISVSNSTLLLERDISESDSDKFEYIAHSIIDNCTHYSIIAERRLLCTSLGIQGILAYSDTELKVDNNIVLAVELNITAVASHCHESNKYIVGFGDSEGKISIALLENDGTWHIGEIHSFDGFDKPITNLEFADDRTLIAVVDNEVMYFFSIGNDYKFFNKRPKPLEIKLPCKGMKIEGLKSENEHKCLSDLINESEQCETVEGKENAKIGAT